MIFEVSFIERIKDVENKTTIKIDALDFEDAVKDFVRKYCVNMYNVIELKITRVRKDGID